MSSSAHTTVQSPIALALHYPTYREVLSAYTELHSLLRQGGCPWTPEQIDSNLLWVGDLQQWVSGVARTQLCIVWNRFWTALWQFRSECAHPLWESKPYLVGLPDHQACAQCGLIRVHTTLSAE